MTINVLFGMVLVLWGLVLYLLLRSDRHQKMWNDQVVIDAKSLEHQKCLADQIKIVANHAMPEWDK